jgi:chromosomal replication initiation ATPase DnaA
MQRTAKIVKRRQPLSTIIPPMIREIIEEHIAKYVKEQGILKYNVEFGYIEESIVIDLEEDIIELSDRAHIMTYQAKVIELFLFDYYKLDKKDKAQSTIYYKIRNREILRVRQVIQFFMSYYADMNLAAIGYVTGKKTHATVINSKKRILRRIRDDNGVKKELFMLDRHIFERLGIKKSQIFDIDTNLIDIALINTPL